MRLTIDTDQRLEDVLRVVGAMFDVTLRVETPGSAEGRSGPPQPGLGRANARRDRARGSGAAKPTRSRERRRTSAPSTADVRRWAAENGHQLSSKGRIPASVMAAYTKAH